MEHHLSYTWRSIRYPPSSLTLTIFKFVSQKFSIFGDSTIAMIITSMLLVEDLLL